MILKQACIYSDMETLFHLSISNTTKLYCSFALGIARMRLTTRLNEDLWQSNDEARIKVPPSVRTPGGSRLRASVLEGLRYYFKYDSYKNFFLQIFVCLMLLLTELCWGNQRILQVRSFFELSFIVYLYNKIVKYLSLWWYCINVYRSNNKMWLKLLITFIRNWSNNWCYWKIKVTYWFFFYLLV